MNLRTFPSAPQPWKGESVQLPLFPPESSWRPPAKPLEPSRRLAVDLETRDPFIKERGPGFKYGEGAPVGIALATEQGAQYLPFAHLAAYLETPKILTVDQIRAYSRPRGCSTDPSISVPVGHDAGLWRRHNTCPG